MYRDTPSPLVITAVSSFVVGLRVADGVEAWRTQVGGDWARLHVTDTRVVAVGARRLTILDYASGRVLASLDDAGGGTLLVVGNLAFVSSQGVLSCIDLESASVRWRNELRGTGYSAAPIGLPGAVAQADLG